MVERRSPKPLVWVRFLHRPQKSTSMTKEIEISKEYIFLITHLKHELSNLALEEITEERLTHCISIVMLLKSKPDRHLSDFIAGFLCSFHHRLPRFLVKQLLALILPPYCFQQETVESYILSASLRKA